METYKSKYTGEEVDNSVGIRTLVSKTAPTNRTQGNVGQFLFDSVTNITYQCKAVTLDTDGTKLYTWKNIMENVGAGDMAKSVYDPTNKARDIFKDIGDLTTLKTTEKGSAVGAINEVVKEIYNPNLLINSYFADPVNQRGQSRYTPTYTYCIDGWIGNGCTVTVGNGYIDITGTGAESKLFQWIENNALTSKTLTLSFNVGGVIYTATGLGSINKAFDNFDLNVGTDGTKMFAQISNFNGKTLRLYSSKFELGSISTLSNDPPPNPQVELAKCQRYLYKPDGTLNYQPAFSCMNNLINTGITFPTTMRIPPTLSGIQVRNTGTGAITDITAFVPTTKYGITNFQNIVPTLADGNYQIVYTASAEL